MGQFVKIRKDLTSKTFGHLTVIDRGEDQPLKDGRYLPTWNCSCDCGGYKANVPATLLIQGHVKSCGCKSHISTLKHGLSKTRIYRVFRGMYNRCYKPETKYYKKLWWKRDNYL